VPEVLQGVAFRHDAHLGIYVYHLARAESLELHADERFRSASLYKLIVLYDAAVRLHAETLDLSEVLTLSQAALDAEPYAEWPLGARTTVGCALNAMVTVSSNAAAAMLLERLGGEEQVTRDAHGWGLSEQTEITKERAYSSPRDIGRLLVAIATDRAVSPEASAYMRGLLAAQRANDRLPLALPLDVPVAHKTGELVRLRNDAGIIYAPSGTYVAVAMVEDALSEAAARAAIVDLSRELYRYFEGKMPPALFDMPQRLALEVLQLPDAQGRLVPLRDPWAGTIALRSVGVLTTPAAEDAALQRFVIPDLLALQRAAREAGRGFWVTAGYRAPRGTETSFVHPSALEPPCAVEMPAREPTPIADLPTPTWTPALMSPAGTTTPTPRATPESSSPSPTPTASPTATPMPLTSGSQHWLGTTFAYTDVLERDPAEEGSEARPTARWLADHAWEYGFIPALPETEAGARLGYEPWRLRWVGRDVAAQLRSAVQAPDYAGTVSATLRQLEADLLPPRP
jgi:beta-lactamase class A